jgi:hypothetical protein
VTKNASPTPIVKDAVIMKHGPAAAITGENKAGSVPVVTLKRKHYCFK